ncbi:hypothetical protein Hanom_Chr12g01108421 [Helianthus anomalus]
MIDGSSSQFSSFINCQIIFVPTKIGKIKTKMKLANPSRSAQSTNFWRHPGGILGGKCRKGLGQMRSIQMRSSWVGPFDQYQEKPSFQSFNHSN